MPSLDKLTYEKGFFGLFLSKSGAGKTSAAATFCEQPNPFDATKPHRVKIHDFDGRALGAKWVDELGIDTSLIDVEYYPPPVFNAKKSIQTPKQAATVAQVADIVDDIIMNAMNRKYPHATHVFDSLTAMASDFMVESLEKIPVGGGAEGKGGGKMLGGLRVEGLPDYQFENRAVTEIFNTIKPLAAFGFNIIFTTHIVPQYERESDEITAPMVDKGKRKTALRDKLEQNILIYFNEVYEFLKEGSINPIHKVKFRSDLARTAIRSLPGGAVDLNGKSFYRVWHELVSAKEGSNSNQRIGGSK